MMQKLTNDPAFWAWLWTVMGLLFTAAGALLGLVIAWAKARTAELQAKTAHIEASAAKDSVKAVAAGQGYQQQTLVQHTAAIAALQATNQATGDRRQATEGAAAPLPGTGMPSDATTSLVPPSLATWPPAPEQQDSPPAGG